MNSEEILLHYKNLPKDKKVTFRNRVCIKAGWSYPLFYWKFREGSLSNSECFFLTALIKEFHKHDKQHNNKPGS